MSGELSTTMPAINIGALLSLAVEKGVPVDTMERMLAMRAQMKAEAARESFFRALATFQSVCPVVAKTKDVMNKSGGSVRYSYAPLDSIIVQVRELLQSHGFAFRFESSTKDTTVTATCIVTHCDGHSESSCFDARIDPESFMNVQQRYGSALTFAKRYAFLNAFGILTGDEDDDAQSTKPDGPTAKRMERIRAMRAAQEVPMVNRGPEEGDKPTPATEVPTDDATVDFITLVNDAADAAELTALVGQYRDLKSEASQTTARRALDNRAKALGLVWNVKLKLFQEV